MQKNDYIVLENNLIPVVNNDTIFLYRHFTFNTVYVIEMKC